MKINQTGCMFEPHVVAVMVNQRVEIIMPIGESQYPCHGRYQSGVERDPDAAGSPSFSSLNRKSGS